MGEASEVEEGLEEAEASEEVEDYQEDHPEVDHPHHSLVVEAAAATDRTLTTLTTSTTHTEEGMVAAPALEDSVLV